MNAKCIKGESCDKMIHKRCKGFVDNFKSEFESTFFWVIDMFTYDTVSFPLSFHGCDIINCPILNIAILANYDISFIAGNSACLFHNVSVDFK